MANDYCLVEDVFDLHDLGFDLSELGTNTQYSREDVEALIETASDAFDRERGGAFRLQDTGNPVLPDNWEDHEWHIPFSHDPTDERVGNLDLDYTQVRPLDPDEGDGIELKRFYRDEYEGALDSYRWEFASNAEGKLRILPTLWRNHNRGRRQPEGVTSSMTGDVLIFRVRYRYGALGGSQRAGGQTDISESLDETTTGTVSTEKPKFLPTGENTMLLGESEYVRVDVSYDTGTESLSVEILERGARHNRSATHNQGATLHYCPFDVRGAVAAYVAAELYDQQEFIDALAEVGGNIDFESRIDRLMEKFRSVVSNDELKG